MKFGTKLIHNGNEIDKETGALGVPIYQTSTFHQEDIDANQKYDYSRSGNPTRDAIEDVIAKLENGDAGFAFSSGMAATSSVLSIFSARDHILISKDIYGGTFRIGSQFFNRFDMEISFVDLTDIAVVKSHIKENTKAIFIETPSNPLLAVTDIHAIIRLAKDNNLTVIVDNTFMTPYLQRPLDMGADIVIHSATKFIGGHSDVVAGLVAVKGEDLAKRIYFVQNGFGAILGPQDAWLLLRGVKTLKVRLDHQQAVAVKLANWLIKHPLVEAVYYPGLDTHPDKAIHDGQADGPGAVLSFRTVDTKTAQTFMKNVTLAAVAVSLGGVETIVSYPVKMSHAAMPEQERIKNGISDCLIRVSVGLEEAEDLIKDFSQALE